MIGQMCSCSCINQHTNCIKCCDHRLKWNLAKFNCCHVPFSIWISSIFIYSLDFALNVVENEILSHCTKSVRCRMLHMRYCCLINGVCTNSVHAWGVGFKIQAGKVRWISLTISRLAAGFSRSFAFSIRFCRIFLPTIRLHFVTVSVQLVTIAWIHSGERVQQQYEKRRVPMMFSICSQTKDVHAELTLCD